jgi:hypothetical protein
MSGGGGIVQGAWDRDKAELAVSLVFGVFGVSGGAVLSLSVALLNTY